MADEVRLPTEAVGGDSFTLPTTTLLSSLNLLPGDGDLERASEASAAFSGPPRTVALIEAGATAASKWWAGGIGASAVAVWAAVRGWWNSASTPLQTTSLWVGSITTAAAVLGIAYLLGSDVRGRAAAQTETIRARAAVADAFIRVVGDVQVATTGAGRWVDKSRKPLFVSPLPLMLVTYTSKPGVDEFNWLAVAVLSDGEQLVKYLVVKDGVHEWADSASIRVP
jgi:hypothetical protein